LCRVEQKESVRSSVSMVKDFPDLGRRMQEQRINYMIIKLDVNLWKDLLPTRCVYAIILLDLPFFLVEMSHESTNYNLDHAACTYYACTCYGFYLLLIISQVLNLGPFIARDR
ncbi:hypothetical protein S83_039198, partial [Arachis hypogaea]